MPHVVKHDPFKKDSPGQKFVDDFKSSTGKDVSAVFVHTDDGEWHMYTRDGRFIRTLKPHEPFPNPKHKDKPMDRVETLLAFHFNPYYYKCNGDICWIC